MIHPSEDPALHVGFREEVAFAVNGSLRGQMTIDILGLNRDELLESRRGILDVLTELVENHAMLAALLGGQSDPASEAAGAYRERLIQMQFLLRRSVEDAAEFVAMARCALR